MNHVLDHKGFRFFQASFNPDEKGTILSVNHDWWGTYVTYVGYILLYLSMLGIFFIGKTRFSRTCRKVAPGCVSTRRIGWTSNPKSSRTPWLNS